MTTYRYSPKRPLAGFSTPDGTEIILIPGQTFELPSSLDNWSYIKQLIEDKAVSLDNPQNPSGPPIPANTGLADALNQEEQFIYLGVLD